MLRPHATRFGQGAPGRPLAILFHGCGGVRDHLARYAGVAKDRGVEAVVIDSYAARGWRRAYGLAFVCTGLALQGRERAGDVLAAAWGLLGEGEPERPLVLAGWSHGSWSIMDLMTMPLTAPGEAGLADPDPAPLRNLRGAFLAYPYGGVGALSRVRPWVRATDLSVISPKHDHVTCLRDARRLNGAPQAAGCRIETWEPDATHSFDEPTCVFPMRHDEALTLESLARFDAFLARAAASDPGLAPRGDRL